MKMTAWYRAVAMSGWGSGGDGGVRSGEEDGKESDDLAARLEKE